MWLAFLGVSAALLATVNFDAGWLYIYAGRLALLTMLFGFLCFICWLAGYAIYVGCLILLAACRLAIMALLAGLPDMLEHFSK
jgi:hypothetical protein